jgi:limonene-1,2-epoxide hydrolase
MNGKTLLSRNRLQPNGFVTFGPKPTIGMGNPTGRISSPTITKTSYSKTASKGSKALQLHMEILSIVMDSQQVFFQWKMLMMFKKFPSTPLHGCTRLTLGDDNRIIYQRDYFDIWGTILNGIPMLRNAYWKFMRRYFG